MPHPHLLPEKYCFSFSCCFSRTSWFGSGIRFTCIGFISNSVFWVCLSHSSFLCGGWSASWLQRIPLIKMFLSPMDCGYIESFAELFITIALCHARGLLSFCIYWHCVGSQRKKPVYLLKYWYLGFQLLCHMLSCHDQKIHVPQESPGPKDVSFNSILTEETKGLSWIRFTSPPATVLCHSMCVLRFHANGSQLISGSAFQEVSGLGRLPALSLASLSIELGQ